MLPEEDVQKGEWNNPVLVFPVFVCHLSEGGLWGWWG